MEYTGGVVQRAPTRVNVMPRLHGFGFIVTDRRHLTDLGLRRIHVRQIICLQLRRAPKGRGILSGS